MGRPTGKKDSKPRRKKKTLNLKQAVAETLVIHPPIKTHAPTQKATYKTSVQVRPIRFFLVATTINTVVQVHYFDDNGNEYVKKGGHNE